VDNQPPYQEIPSGTPPPPPGSGFTYYPEHGAQGYPQPEPGYGPPPGYPPPGPGYGPPPGYPQPGPGFMPPPGYAPLGPTPVYAQPVGVYAPTMPDPGKGMAITGFVMGIVSVLLLCTFYGSFIDLIVGGLGITFSLMGRKSTTSRGLAIAGLVMSIIAVVISVVFVLIIIGIIAAAANTPQYNSNY